MTEIRVFALGPRNDFPAPESGTDQVGFDPEEGQWFAMETDDDGWFFNSLSDALEAWFEWHQPWPDVPN